MKTRLLILILSLILVIVAAACAIADSPVKQGPPLTLWPPPTPVFDDDISCDDTAALESWLQSSTFMKEDFLDLAKATKDKRRGDIHDDVAELAARRDKMSAIAVPDCTTEAHIMIVDAMNKAVTVFLEYNNGDREELGDIVNRTEASFDAAGIIQAELTDRLEQQYKNR
jgi:hypothetical protein